MTPHRTINWALAALLALLLSAAHLLDGPSGHTDAVVVSDDLQDAIKTDAKRLRFEAAAQALCGGENAAWTLLADDAVQCATKRGHKTIVAKVAP